MSTATTTITAPQIHQIGRGETRAVTVSFDGKQAEGETLIDTAESLSPVVLGIPIGGTWTVTDPVLNASLIRVNNKRVLPNKALQFSVTVSNAANTGVELLTVKAESSSGEILVGIITFEVVNAETA